MLSKKDYKKMVERSLSLTTDEKIQVRDFVELAYQGDKSAINALEQLFDIKFVTWGDVYTLGSFVFKTMPGMAKGYECNTIKQRLELRTTKKIDKPSKIAFKRMAAGLTQTQLAEAIKSTQKDISRWENGVRTPKADALKKIADALDCKIDDLIE